MDQKELLWQIERTEKENWTTLDLAGEGIEGLPPEIGQLADLEVLDLYHNQLTTLPPEIGQLTHLQSLHLAGNRLTTLPPEIGHLTNLQALHLNRNQLTTLPPEIGQLTNLGVLTLNNSHFSALPPEIGQLTDLRVLTLNNSQLTTLPPEIGQLTDLQELHLDDSHLTTLPPEIGQLANLQKLYLDRNQLTTLPPEIDQLTNLRVLNFSNSQLIRLPPEIVAQGAKAIWRYLRGFLEEGSRQWISKMLVVGEGGVGKTQLLRALRYESFEEHSESTHGIQIGEVHCDHPSKPDVTMRLNAWDFGGQHIYHATHQFFLTNRSLFVVVWNARLGYEQGKLFYWLDTIKALAPDSPVLLVATHVDERDASLPLQDLQDKYPQIAGSCAISNKEPRQGINELRATVAQLAADLPLMGEMWPATWLEAAEEVRTHPKKHVTPGQLHTMICRAGVKESSVPVLERWLHELGEILYFHDNDDLNDTVILKPQWVTEYISKVLESEEVTARHGIFTRRHMDELWSDLLPAMREHFLRLMEKFDLSYRTLEDREISLVVERLPLDVHLDYEAKWARAKAPEHCREITMRFRLDSVPAGVPTWFIARAHRFTTYTHWHSGALFADREQAHTGSIRAYQHDRYVELSVRGPYPANFFALLRDGLELTLDRFPGLGKKRTVPCPGHNGQPCDHEFDLEDLLRRRKPLIECPRAEEDVSVAQLLYGVHWEKVTLETVSQELHDFRAQTTREHQEQNQRLQALAELTQREFLATYRREQESVDAQCPNVFTLSPKQRGGLRCHWDRMTQQTFELQLFCQAPGDWQPYGQPYEINVPAEWLQTMAPYLRRLADVMKLVAPLTGPWLSWADEKSYKEFFKRDVELAKALVDKLPDSEKSKDTPLVKAALPRDKVERAEGAAVRALRMLLNEQDPTRDYRGLRKLISPEGHHFWLCPEHFKEYKTRWGL